MRNRRTPFSYDVYIPYANLVLLVLGLLLLAGLAGTGMGFSIWNATRIEQIHHNDKCIPDHLRSNECLVGIERKADADSEFCTTENRVKGYDCDDACIVGHGECDGQGTCVGECLFDCVDASTCPDIGPLAPGLANVTDCVLGGCTTFVFGPDPLGLCGSEKSFQTCRDAIPESPYSGCLSTSQLCDSGLVLACVYTASCHHVDDFDPPPIVRSVNGNSPQGKTLLTQFNTLRSQAIFNRQNQ